MASVVSHHHLMIPLRGRYFLTIWSNGIITPLKASSYPYNGPTPTTSQDLPMSKKVALKMWPDRYHLPFPPLLPTQLPPNPFLSPLLFSNPHLSPHVFCSQASNPSSSSLSSSSSTSSHTYISPSVNLHGPSGHTFTPPPPPKLPYPHAQSSSYNEMNP